MNKNEVDARVVELLELLSVHTCKPHFYPLHTPASIEDELRLIQPSIYHALELVEKMLREEIAPLQILKIFKMVLCSHKNESIQRLLCSSICESIVFKYIP